MKKVVRILVLIIMLLIIPKHIKGLTGSVSLSCGKTKLIPGESTVCTIKGTTSEAVSAVSIHVTPKENLTLTNVKVDEIWQGNGDEGDIEIYTDNNKTGTFNIGEITVKAGNITTGYTTGIELKNMKFTNASFQETEIASVTKDIRIPSNVDTLNGITLDGTTVTGFSKTVLTYSLTVESTKKSTTIAVTKGDENQTVKGTGTKQLLYGKNRYEIEVNSEIGTSRKYIIEITRPEVRELKSLRIGKETLELKSGLYNYTVKVGYDVTSVEVEAIVANAAASLVENYGNRTVKELKVGTNEILVKTKDADNEQLTYKIIVNRLDKNGKDTTVSNPKTGVMDYTIIIGSLLLIAVIAFVLVRNKSKFPLTK